MKIKWILRFKNKPVLVALIAAVAAFVYQIFGILGYAPAVSESEVIEYAGLIINLLVAVGIITDPTTAGVYDTDAVMDRTAPRKENEVVDDEDELQAQLRAIVESEGE